MSTVHISHGMREPVSPGRLLLATIGSHDQFNTTIHSNDDRHLTVEITPSPPEEK